MGAAPSDGERTKAVPLFTKENSEVTTRRHLVYRALDAPDQPTFACGVSHDHPDHTHDARTHITATHNPDLADASGPLK
jgi:hypothetical protein